MLVERLLQRVERGTRPSQPLLFRPGGAGSAGAASSPCASDSTVWISAPSACTARVRHERAGLPSSSTVHAPQTPCSQPTWVP